MAVQNAGSIRFFLGANSKNGFASLYDSFTDPSGGDFMWVIKGGPGCGKSTFMRRIGAAAEAAGFAVEYILCSGDPDSLDAVYFPEKRVAYVDGTAPHVVEAKYPGAASLYLDLGCFLDAGALESRLADIAALNQHYKGLYADAYAQLAAGAALLPKNLALWSPADLTKLDKKLAGLAARELRKKDKPGRLTRRFLSARSCQGHLRLTDTATALCDRIWTLDNELGMAHIYLAGLTDIALTRGYDVIQCPDPLEPEKLEAVLLPEPGLGFLAIEKALPFAPTPYRHLRLDAMVTPPTPEAKSLLRQRRRESALLFSSAENSLARAKAIHDDLEAVYRPHVDFNGLDALTEDHIRWLLGN